VSEILESGSDHDVNNAAIREQVEIIEHTLESFGAPATVVEINQGPTVTQFGVEPNYIQMRNGRQTKVKVGKIAGLADDLALALAAKSIRIQAPVPGKSYVGIEVPNPAKALVALRDVMESPGYGRIKGTLGLGLGQNVSGEAIVANLATMPHLLIAGTTGSGKSVCVNSIIACLLLENTPDDLKLIMIDPKRVELTGYNGIPHLAAPVVVEMDRVISTLQWALREMDRRYEAFAAVGARQIDEYNKKTSRRRDSQKMPYIVIIIDELADLMMLAPEDTERAVTRLAQMARATGIHMVIATQRPSVDVVTGLIKANFPARIAFAVASGTDSRVILDTTGAERLLGQGDMLFQKPDAPAPLRLQGCYTSDA
jgi:S-DNA-T family DNA segregation ATPase FtsK/SpoIIIE